MRRASRRTLGLALIWVVSCALVFAQGWLIAAATAPHTVYVPDQRPAVHAPSSVPGTPPATPSPATTRYYAT